ncbi:phytoene/squalene synthase family protein [Yunchengibacter salinarum]|uniref:phytoene/squalene synthase family protein n=1 Tax=Yunchengibacter salinarum TaxID=3133399 RepID=UPI0035B5B5BD
MTNSQSHQPGAGASDPGDPPLDPVEYCRGSVRQDDPDRYLVSLFCPAESQAALWAIHAFNQEIGKTRESVSDPTLGQIRLQWWRESLEAIEAGTPRRHPVVEALARIEGFDGLYPILIDMIDAREQDLFDTGPDDFDALADYTRRAAGGVTVAAMWVLGAQDDHLVAGRAAGAAFGMTGLIRATAYHSALGTSRLPQEDVTRAGLAPEAARQKEAQEALRPIFMRMVAFARSEAKRARSMRRRIPSKMRAPMLELALVDQYLAIIESRQGRAFELPLDKPSRFSKMLTLMGRSLLGRY